MKKFLALGVTCMIGAASFAQNSEDPVVITDASARSVTADGKWVGCYGASSMIYNVETGEGRIITECQLGLGNAIASDGTGVGSRNDMAVLMSGTRGIVPEPLREFNFSSFNAITPDGSRVTGFIMNPEVSSGTSSDPFDDGLTIFIPFYCDIEPDGTMGPVNIIPYPEKDFLGYAPMYVTGVWISEDGKTILGQMTDSFGRFIDPVVFHESENGEWSYLTPTKEFSNPEGIVLPPNPWTSAPPVPQLKDYMYPDSFELYMEELLLSLSGLAPEPDPFDYMDEEQIEAYLAACDEYENYFPNHKEEIDAYEKAYREILSTSMYFGEVALDPKGKRFATTALNYNDEGTGAASQVFIFDTATGEYRKIESHISELNIHQMLSDGTVIAYTGLFTYGILNSYILLPDREDFIKMSDYLAEINPGYAEWLHTIFPYGDGIVSTSDDMSVVAGGLDFLHLADEGMYPDATLLSYVLPNVTSSASVGSIELQPQAEIYHVFNLQGIKVLETKNKEDIKGLAKGIYIINGKKIAL